MPTERLNLREKINFTEAIRTIKLKLCRIVHNISLYDNIVFHCRSLRTLVAMATLSSHGLTMGKLKWDFIAISLQIF